MQQGDDGRIADREFMGKGSQGYGWPPYDYVLDRLALDFWSLVAMEWVDAGHSGCKFPYVWREPRFLMRSALISPCAWYNNDFRVDSISGL
ncbi:MAG: hypothetical protein K2P57_01075 [Burkholderiales bacterium]|nr:hypothetical protein [Burkholderiales bacterium]